MPINRAYKLPDLMEAIKYYVNRTGRRITFEYGLFGGEMTKLSTLKNLLRLKRCKMSCELNSGKLRT